ncbi:MAG: tetratricopeptide repeat protein [Prevotellaceae bacterium]|jgi:tetratricopeptide (TPR) repeat protein|nr:tetratricopeptide repeat protein [Prevotellaceae bacterium]
MEDKKYIDSVIELAVKSPSEALKKSNQDIESNPNCAEAYLKEGFSHSIDNSEWGWQIALNCFDKALEIDPNYASVYSLRGDAYFRWGNNEAAIADFDKALELCPTDAPSYRNRGNAKKDLGDYPGAIDDYDNALKYYPDYNKGIGIKSLEYDSRVIRNARKDAKAKLNNENSIVEKYLNMTRENFIDAIIKLSIEENWTVVRRILEKIIKLNPNCAEAYFMRGHQYYNEYYSEYYNDNQQPISDFDKAIEIDPNFIEAYNGLGICNGYKSDDDFKKAIEICPTYAPAYESLAEYTRVRNKDYPASIAYLDKAIELCPTYVPAYESRGNIKKELGDYQGAIDDYENALKYYPDCKIGQYCNYYKGIKQYRYYIDWIYRKINDVPKYW